MKFDIRVPKEQWAEKFAIYVLNPTDTHAPITDAFDQTTTTQTAQAFEDKYHEYTEYAEFEFDPDTLIIDFNDRNALETEINTLPSRVWELEHILGRAESLLESLMREEKSYTGISYGEIVSNMPAKSTVDQRNNKVVGDSVSNPVMQAIYTYVGKSRVDVHNLKITIKALTSHLFKCKELYQSLFASRPAPAAPFS